MQVHLCVYYVFLIYSNAIAIAQYALCTAGIRERGGRCARFTDFRGNILHGKRIRDREIVYACGKRRRKEKIGPKMFFSVSHASLYTCFVSYV